MRELVLAACLVGVLTPASAQATTIPFVKTTLYNQASVKIETVTPGATGTGKLEIKNSSDGDEANGTMAVTQVTLLPSCGKEDGDKDCSGVPINQPGPGPDPGVITITGPGHGTVGCNNIDFTVTPPDPDTGKVSFVPSGSYNLGVGSTCVISFTYTVHRLTTPTKDSSPGASGAQTDLVGYARAVAAFNNRTGSNTGHTPVDVKANPTWGPARRADAESHRR